jgi:hypothetical protein
LQETKRDTFDIRYIRKFALKRFDRFDFCPSVGAFGGILVCWVSSYINIITIEKQLFAIRMSISSAHNYEAWNLVVVYGPSRQPRRDTFVSWLYSLNIDDDELWLLIGDFNFYRYAKNRNRLGGNFDDTLLVGV